MVRRVMVGLAAVVVAVLFTPAAPASAEAPSAVTVAGPGIAGTLTVSDRQQDALRTLLRLVSWMADAPGDANAPESDALGDRYTLTLISAGSPITRIELYPHAAGGPRAYRPQEQPGGRYTSEAWFSASVSTATALASAGIPVSGAAVEHLTNPLDAGAAATPAVAWRQAMLLFRYDFLLSIAVGVGVALVLAAVARRVSRSTL
jgi:hypothetical protein